MEIMDIVALGSFLTLALMWVVLPLRAPAATATPVAVLDAPALEPAAA